MGEAPQSVSGAVMRGYTRNLKINVIKQSKNAANRPIAALFCFFNGTGQLFFCPLSPRKRGTLPEGESKNVKKRKRGTFLDTREQESNLT